MRNWNDANSKFILVVKDKLPAYLWGIETAQYPKPYKQYDLLPAYLWGIETVNIYAPHPSPPFIASLPMRNWNSVFRVIQKSEALDCQPTYEELKLGYWRGIKTE